MEKALEMLNNIYFDDRGIMCIEKSTALDVFNAIAELEEAMKPKTCEKCKNFEFDQEFNDGYGQCFFGIHFPNSQSLSYHKFDDGYCSLFEPKEK